MEDRVSVRPSKRKYQAGHHDGCWREGANGATPQTSSLGVNHAFLLAPVRLLERALW